MTELFSKADKIEVYLDDEEVTVPTGKVWVVTITCRIDDDMRLEDASGESLRILQGNDDRGTNIAQDITVHEDWTIGASGTNAFVTGWQFDYSG